MFRNKIFDVLVVDDEPDVHQITALALRGLKYRNHRLRLKEASSGEQAVLILRENPDVALILMDVIMESDTAGLDAVRVIRGELGNTFSRIILRTGQPGIAPEKTVIDEFDIDGYLAKSEVTATRLHTVVRSAVKAYDELCQLESHRETLSTIHDCILSLHSYDSVETHLQSILDAAASVCPTSLAALHLETFEDQGNPRKYDIAVASDNTIDAEAEGARLVGTFAKDPIALAETSPAGGGFVVPFSLARALGNGWLYVADPDPIDVARKGLSLLAAHAVNGLYSSIAQSILVGRDGDLFETMQI